MFLYILDSQEEFRLWVKVEGGREEEFEDSGEGGHAFWWEPIGIWTSDTRFTCPTPSEVIAPLSDGAGDVGVADVRMCEGHLSELEVR